MKRRSNTRMSFGCAVSLIGVALCVSCSSEHCEDCDQDVNPFYLAVALTMPEYPGRDMTAGINWDGRYSVRLPPNTLRMGTLSEQQHAGFQVHAACANLKALWFHQVDFDRCMHPQDNDAYKFIFGGPQTDDPNDMGCGMTVCVAPDAIEGPTREHVAFLLGLFDELTTAHAE